jgi:phenylalanyl-tRNA synthetase alpha subunit
MDRVFRNETMDATHLAEFHQVEGSPRRSHWSVLPACVFECVRVMLTTSERRLRACILQKDGN